MIYSRQIADGTFWCLTNDAWPTAGSVWSRYLKCRRNGKMGKWACNFLMTTSFCFFIPPKDRSDVFLFVLFLLVFFSPLVSVCVSVNLSVDDGVKIGLMPWWPSFDARWCALSVALHLFSLHKSPLRAVTQRPALMCCPGFISRLKKVERRVTVKHRSQFLKLVQPAD